MTFPRRAATAITEGACAAAWPILPWRRLGALALLPLCLAAAHCDRTTQPPKETISAQTLASLLAKLNADADSDIAREPSGPAVAPNSDPNWPTLAYLVGELDLKHHDIDQARAAFANLASWGASDSPQSASQKGPVANGWGGSGLATFALWRWLKILDEHGGDSKEVERALQTAAALQKTRFFAGVVRPGFLPAVPLLEEDIAHRLVHLANRNNRPETMSLLLDFLNIDSSGKLDPIDAQIVEKMIQDGLVSRERLSLFRYRRQLGLVKLDSAKKEAAEQLQRLWATETVPADVRAEAAFEWANFNRQSGLQKKEIISALTAAYELTRGKGRLAQDALFLRAMIQNSLRPTNADLFFSDMQSLLDQYPDSHLVDDALYQVATEHLFGPKADPALAFATFDRLRALTGKNDYEDSAYVVAAIGRIDRGEPQDLDVADRLLIDYGQKYPDGAFRQRAVFWRGRIAELKHDAASATRLFQQIVRETPFDYYGLRARLHLESGVDAINTPLPGPGSRSFEELRTAYQRSSLASDLIGTSLYHRRLLEADRARIYVQALNVVNGLGPRFRNRLDNIALEDLDSSGLLPDVALLLTLRQDAFAARDAETGAGNRLSLTSFLGRRIGDWPAALMMLSIPTGSHFERLTELQNDARYPATAYPNVAEIKPLRESLREVTWPIDGSATLTRSLMYAVERTESAYYPGAISAAGAMGLFQVMPRTFVGTKQCWKPGSGPAPTPAPYLFDPALNAEFWSCWIRLEFKPKVRSDVPFILIRTNAGSGHLDEWRRSWAGRRTANDLELQIDTLRFPETQTFVRRTLADTAIAEAADLATPPADSGQTPAR